MNNNGSIFPAAYGYNETGPVFRTWTAAGSNEWNASSATSPAGGPMRPWPFGTIVRPIGKGPYMLGAVMVVRDNGGSSFWGVSLNGGAVSDFNPLYWEPEP